MDEMLAKILEMDKISRKQAEEAEEAKKKAFDELSLIRTSLIEKKLADAQKTISDLLENKLKESDQKATELRTKNKAAQAKLHAAFAENGEKWVNDIYKRVLE